MKTKNTTPGYSYYKWEFNPTMTGTEAETQVWFGTTEEPEFYDDHAGYWEIYDYEDYVGLMQAVLAMELGLDEEVGT